METRRPVEAPADWASSLSAHPSAPLTINYSRRTLTMHQVTSGELDAVASLNNAVNLGLFGISAGAFLSLAITTATVPLVSPVLAASFAGATLAAAVASLFFGLRALIEVREARQRLSDLKRGAASG